MKFSARLLIASVIASVSATALIIACTDEAVVPPNTPDSSTGDTGVADTSPQVDSSKPDVTINDAGPPDALNNIWGALNLENDAAVCPLVGTADDQFLPGGGSCTACVRGNCCAALQACVGAANPNSTLYSDGGFTDCYYRVACIYESGCGQEADSGGCDKACEAKFSAATNALAAPVINCILGPHIGSIEGTQTPGNCSMRDDGGLRCSAN